MHAYNYISAKFDTLSHSCIKCVTLLFIFNISIVLSPRHTFISQAYFSGHADVNLSHLSQVISSRLARGTYNCSLRSTEAGILAQVVADGTITLTGYLGEGRLLNVTLIPSLPICLTCILSTFLTFPTLYW